MVGNMLHELVILVCYCLFVASAQECQLDYDCSQIEISRQNISHTKGIDVGSSCPTLPPLFSDVVNSFLKEVHYQLRPVSCLTSSVLGAQRLRSGEEAFCDNGWTVFQRRVNGSVEFGRNWQDYKSGFGNLRGEFWLGLDKIHSLTSMKLCKLRVDLTSLNDEQAFAEYRVFAVENETDNYRLRVEDYNNASTAGDSLYQVNRPHNKMQFSTKDRDNDQASTNCADSYKGGWWYNNCFHANLNAPWTLSQFGSLIWPTWKGWGEPLKATTMKFRCG